MRSPSPLHSVHCTCTCGHLTLFTLFTVHVHAVTDLAKDGTYGGNDAIVAFSRRFELDVIIHQLSAPCLEVLCPVRLQASASPRALHIAYLYGDHYCSVRPVGASKESGPVVLPPARTGEKPVSKTHSQASKDGTSVPSPCSVSSSVAKEADDPQLEELLMLTGCVVRLLRASH